MAPSRNLLAFVMSGGFIGGILRTSLSFSTTPLSTRIANLRDSSSSSSSSSCCHCQRSPKQYYFQRAPATSTTVVPVSTKHGDMMYRSSASTGLHALPSPLLGLLSLDGMPGMGNSAVSPPGAPATTSNINTSSATRTSFTSTATSVKRSRRGKYPVIELWRQETGEFLDGERGLADDENGNELMGREQPTRAPRGAHTALGYLRAVLGLGVDQTDAMLEAFPALAEVSPDKLDVRAKLRFLQHTMRGDGATLAVSFPQFFGHPLERHIAPRHAFLVASRRPSGASLLEGDCRGLRRMLELPANRFVTEMVPERAMSDYRRFEQGFLRGPFDAARKGDAETLRLLRSHGWDCWETDRRGRSALFWAAGGGSVQACTALTEEDGGLRVRDSGGDGSTPLHWAAAGVHAKRFGTGGHVHVCRWLLSRGADAQATTAEGNTVVMWAAWAGGLDTTRWAVEEAGVDLDAANINGCSVAHWAASGGDEVVCRYLHSKGVDFTRKNKGGNDPLNHAVAYGRRHIAAWLLGEGATLQGLGGANDIRVECERRKDDPVLLDLARLTGDEKMEAFLTEGDVDAVV